MGQRPELMAQDAAGLWKRHRYHMEADRWKEQRLREDLC